MTRGDGVTRVGTGLVARMLTAAALVAGLLGGCGGAEATPAPAPAGGLAQELRVTAQDIAYRPASLSAVPGVALAIRFENLDAGIPHDLALYAGAAFATELAKTEIITGPQAVPLDVPGLVPGRYQFRCTVHPTMVSDLTVGG